MVHGMWGGSWCWDNYIRYFTNKGFDCVPVILRHHQNNPGQKSPVELGFTSISDYADDITELITKLDHLPVLMGHSMGGLIGQILASRGLVDKLILLAPAPPRGINALYFSVVKSFLSLLTRYQFWKKPHRISYSNAEYALFNQLPVEQRREVYDKFVYESGRAALEIGLWWLDVEKNTEVDEAEVKCPVLVLTGTEDRMVPPAVAKKIAEKYKKVSTYMEFNHHAHWLVGEPGWEKIAGKIDQWISKI
ncbi:MAG: alpha/beta hydrolase [Desulfuromonas sp. SDB]|nr:MAG: alpha/beta hydrolase [Desulfuromonas sp. SDB]